MRRFLWALGLVIGSVLAVNAQNDTIFYDANWAVSERADAEFYRPKPVAVEGGFLVKDYYISGVLQMQGVSSSETEELWEGETSWYYPSGEVSQRRSYRGGLLEGNSSNFDMSGKLMSSAEYKEGEPYSGSVWATDFGSDFITYYEAGRKVKTEIYSREAVSKARCEVVFVSDSNYRISFFDQKGESAGVLNVEGDDRARMSGVFVSYLYHPMVVEKSMTIEDGELKNPVKYFYSSGKLKREEYYLGDSELIKEVAFNSEGTFLDSLIYKDSYPYMGTKYEFYYAVNSSLEADKLERVTKYVKGEISGTATEFYMNGVKRLEKVYKLGEVTELTNFDSLGVVVSKAVYKDGMPWEGTVNEMYNNSYVTYKEGVVVLEKRYNETGALVFIKDLTVEESYDSTGVCVAHLDYVDGNPYNGKSIYSYNDEVLSVTEYKNGVMTLSMSYSDGVESERIVYTETGEIKARSDFFSNGKLKSITTYVNGYERNVSYFTVTGAAAGKLTIDENGDYNGVKYGFSGDVVNSYEEYENGKISRLKSYNSESVLISDVDYNGVAIFYDLTNDKSYKCTYKNGEPFEGTNVKFDSYYKGITSLSNYKNGLIEGESCEYEYDYNSSTYVPLTVTTYSGGKLNGLFKQYRNGVLASTCNYVNDVANGATSFYDAKGELLSTAIYKDGLPYDGVVYEFDYLHQVSSIIPYKNGVIDGEAKYYEDNKLNYTLLYLNNDIVKQVSYLDGVAKYSLVYRDGMKYEGDEFSANTLTHYANGAETLSTEYADEVLTSIVKKRITVGDVVTESVYYSNNQLKSSIDYKGYSKDGRARFYSADGKEIANGTFVDDYPSVGSFVYFSYDNDLAYLRVEISSKQVVVTEFVDNSQKRTVRYDLPVGDSELQSTEIANIISGLSSMFPDYKVDSGY